MAPLEETQHMADVAKLDKDGVFEEAFYTDPERLMKVVSRPRFTGSNRYPI